MELAVVYALANNYRKNVAGIIRTGDLPLRGFPIGKSRTYEVELKKKAHGVILHALLEHFFS
jgi:hypothetical protein